MATGRAYQRNIRDKDLLVTTALPAAASTTVNGTPIDLGAASFGKAIHRGEGVELVARIPALNTTQLPDTKTLTATIQTSEDSAFGSGVRDLSTSTTTGAGGAGAVASELRASVPSDCFRYVRLKTVTGAATGDQSASSTEFAVVI
jgi:hypothetical protein